MISWVCCTSPDGLPHNKHDGSMVNKGWAASVTQSCLHKTTRVAARRRCMSKAGQLLTCSCRSYTVCDAPWNTVLGMALARCSVQQAVQLSWCCSGAPAAATASPGAQAAPRHVSHAAPTCPHRFRGRMCSMCHVSHIMHACILCLHGRASWSRPDSRQYTEAKAYFCVLTSPATGCRFKLQPADSMTEQKPA